MRVSVTLSGWRSLSLAEPGPPIRPSPAPQPGPSAPAAAGTEASTRTHGFLFADLRDYTSYVDERGDHAGAELLRRYRALVRGAVAAARGAEIKTEGDSFYVVFDSASAAVRCGQEIISAADAASGEPIRVGVGVHAGETVETAEGFVGSAVNIAARICAQAKAGELVVSETVRSLTRTYLDAEFEALGTRRLRGVEEPIVIYRVTSRGTATARAGRARRAGRRTRWWLVGAGIAALVLVVGAAGAAIWLGARPGPTAAPSEAPSTTPSAAATPGSSEAPPSLAAGALTAAEEALLARIPLDFQPYCSRSNVEDGAAGGLASLRCDLRGSPGYGADSVWYDAFDESTRGQMEVAVNDVMEREDIPVVEGGSEIILSQCTSGAGKAQGRWYLGSTFSGRLACYPKDGAAWLMWTYEGPNIVARAVRTDGDAESLQTWWRERAAAYLR
jgi:class 3 adenylate cyclase